MSDGALIRLSLCLLSLILAGASKTAFSRSVFTLGAVLWLVNSFIYEAQVAA